MLLLITAVQIYIPTHIVLIDFFYIPFSTSSSVFVIFLLKKIEGFLSMMGLFSAHLCLTQGLEVLDT